MRVAVFGGSFNPPHVGHALVCGWLLWTRRADAVWLVPAFAHPFGKKAEPFPRRVALCRAMADDIDPARVSVCEAERDLPVPSYTIDTLDHLAAAHPEHRFRLVVGADLLPDTPRWKAWDRIVARFDPIVVGRAGYPCPPDAVAFPGVSSTEIRARLADGRPVDHLLTAGVASLLQA